jgi:hypothetical protein
MLYLIENTTRLHDNDQLVNAVREKMAVNSENHTKQLICSMET